MGEEKDLLSALILELRRGTLTISVLSQMAEPKYGYALVQSLEAKGVAIDPNCIRCSAGWRARDFWRANGRQGARSPENIISALPTAGRFTAS